MEKKIMYTELLFEGHVQVFFCPDFLLYALEVKRGKGLNLILEFIKLKQFIGFESLSFSEKQYFLVFWGKLGINYSSFYFIFLFLKPLEV